MSIAVVAGTPPPTPRSVSLRYSLVSRQVPRGVRGRGQVSELYGVVAALHCCPVLGSSPVLEQI